MKWKAPPAPRHGEVERIKYLLSLYLTKSTAMKETKRRYWFLLFSLVLNRLLQTKSLIHHCNHNAVTCSLKHALTQAKQTQSKNCYYGQTVQSNKNVQYLIPLSNGYRAINIAREVGISKRRSWCILIKRVALKPHRKFFQSPFKLLCRGSPRK